MGLSSLARIVPGPGDTQVTTAKRFSVGRAP